MGRQLVTVQDLTLDFSDVPIPETVYTDIIHTPSWARHADFYLNALTVAGGTNTVDLALSYVDPLDKTTAVAYPGSGITQITAAGMVIVRVGSLQADDDTGPIYTLNGPLPPTLKSVLTVGTQSVDEVQEIDLGDFAAGDSTKFTFDSVETTTALAFNTLDAGASAAARAAIVKAILDEVIPTADFTVTETTENLVYDVNFQAALSNQDVGAITITSATGFTPAGVTESTAGVAGDETYDINYSVVYSR